MVEHDLTIGLQDQVRNYVRQIVSFENAVGVVTRRNVSLSSLPSAAVACTL